MTQEMIKRKKEVRKSIASLTEKCNKSQEQTVKTLNVLKDSLEVEEFNLER